jgi:hypothetical protein
MLAHDGDQQLFIDRNGALLQESGQIWTWERLSRFSLHEFLNDW